MTAGTLARRTLGGYTFLASNRTAAHLEWTISEVRRLHPFARLQIIQPCYNTGIAASAGTHDKDAVLDVRIDGLGWWDAQLLLRRCGWAAWFRHTGLWANEDSWHIHMCSIPEGLSNTPSIDDIDAAYARAGIEVGIYVPGQVDDYFAHALGLKGQHRAGSDSSRFPRDIAATIYRYQEDAMSNITEWSAAEKLAFQQLVRGTDIEIIRDGERVQMNLGAVVRELEETQDVLNRKLDRIIKKIGA